MIHSERISLLNDQPVRNRNYVLYWMQASQRAEYNHALEFAIIKANEANNPLVVFFGITDSYPEANERHYYFMLEGLKEVQSSLEKRGIQMLVRHVSPETGVIDLCPAASCVVVDAGYTKVQRRWREKVASHINCALFQVETDVIVPLTTASTKEEYSAATIRKKIQRHRDTFLVPLRKSNLKKDSFGLRLDGLSLNILDDVVARLKIDRSVRRTHTFMGGTSQAVNRLKNFIKNRLSRFSDLRNDPTKDYLSNMSPYLHFGQISPLYIALKVKEAKSKGEDAFLEELIVRRELSMNFVFYNSHYDSFACLPAWAQSSLTSHQKDRRPYLYPLNELEEAQTHDPYWNAAQQEMLITGKMHGYMRMYWGKKILEWTRSPQEAYRIALYLNNKYELDGRDPNGFAGVAWCFGKHDRPWAEREIFGKVRYMNSNGLRRKFDADGYVKKVAGMRS